NYSFQHVNLLAELNQGEFTVHSNICDPNIETSNDLDGSILPHLSVHGIIRVGRADLFNLGITADSLQYAGNINVDASFDQPGKIDSVVQADSNIVVMDGKQIFTDRILLKCLSSADTMQINIRAPFIDAQLA